jgi:hypothetical protein
MADELADHDPALDPSPAEIRERVERETDEVRREAHEEEAALHEHAQRQADAQSGEGGESDS